MPSLNTGNAILSNAIAVDSSYNVGIGGAASGSYKLQVTGNVNADNFIIQPTGYGLLASLSRDLTGSGFGVLNLKNGSNGFIQPAALSVDRTYTLPDATGTIALTSNLSAYLPLTGGTLTGALSGTSATFTTTVTPLILKSTSATTMWTEYYYNTSTLSGYIGSGSGILSGANNSDFIVRSEADLVLTTGNNRRMTIASSTGAATFSSSVTANSGVQSQVIGSDGTYGASYPMYSFTGTTNGSSRIFCGIGSDFMYFAAGTGSGFQFRPNGSTTASMLITSGGDVGIGNSGFASTRLTTTGKSNTSSDYSFVANNASNSNLFLVRNDGLTIMQTSYSNAYRINDTGGGWVTLGMQNSERWSINYLGRFSGYGAGTLTTDVNGFITASSDRNLKDIIKPLENVLDKIMDFEPVYFKWNNKTDLDRENVYISTIAQSIEKDFPEAVGKMKDGTLTVQDRAVLAIAIKAIQELNQKIEAQQQQINSLINR
jgi:hypothetical protein